MTNGNARGDGDNMVRLIKYGSRLIPVSREDKAALLESGGYVEADVFRIVPGSSISKQHGNRTMVLVAAITDIEAGEDSDSVIRKYNRDFGPGLRRALSDCLIRVGDYGYTKNPAGGGPFDARHEETADGELGDTAGGDTGGPEFGYGSRRNRGPSNLFLNAPESQFGHGDESGYDEEHMPGKPSVQKKTPRMIERDVNRGAATHIAGPSPMPLSPKKKYPGDTVYNNDQGYNEPFGDEQGLKQAPPFPIDTRGPVLGVPIDPVDFKVDDDNKKKRDDVPPEYAIRQGGPEGTPEERKKQRLERLKKRVLGSPGGAMPAQPAAPDEAKGEFSTHDVPSVGNIDSGTALMGY